MGVQGKYLVLVLLSANLLANLMFFSSVNASSTAIIYVDPARVKGEEYAPHTSFTIAVLVANVTDLSTASFNVSYEPSVLSCRSFRLGALQHNPKPQWQANDQKGFIWLNITYDLTITTAIPLTLVNVTFSILTRGETALDIHASQLTDSNALSIPHTANDGYFNNLPSYDINRDGKIDILDLATVAHAFGSYPGHPRWNPDADVNEDEKVDIKDIAIVASHFGEIV